MNPTRDKLIAAARTLFHQRGYAPVGVAEICREAGVVKGSFYHFFPAKEDLAAAVVESNWADLHSELEQLLNQGGSAAERIAGFVSGVVSNALQMQSLYGRIYGCNIGNLACELGPGNSAVQTDLRLAMLGWRSALQALLEQGQADGSVARGLEPQATAETLLATIQGMSVLGRTLDDVALLQRVADTVTALLLRPHPPENSRKSSRRTGP